MYKFSCILKQNHILQLFPLKSTGYLWWFLSTQPLGSTELVGIQYFSEPLSAAVGTGQLSCTDSAFCSNPCEGDSVGGGNTAFRRCNTVKQSLKKGILPAFWRFLYTCYRAVSGNTFFFLLMFEEMSKFLQVFFVLFFFPSQLLPFLTITTIYI